eukprot:CAMPEP_0119548858 /NCGR_PEP_ID=MMETSP1352-20130426/2694_1 /TAXON_ID=265584 /ORGANISM="Stauroneis constricta, Strain CCMP1120" /LENGTH=261 /DNA_ID=CAMNT_0007594253 /DNA_START=106 /DNA_END=891 /DNA_ORIENTATION=+
MKLSTATILATVMTGANAFVAPSTTVPATALRMADAPTPEEEAPEQAAEPIMPPTPPAPQMSQSMPFMERPSALDGSLAGDVGFDPLGFAKSQADLMKFREAEVKHARLAMLAAAGWPISELFDKNIANTLGLQPVVDASDRAPSVLNGGLGKISPVYWIACLAFAAGVEVYGLKRASNTYPDYTPGDLGFDPLGVFPKTEEGKKWFELAEIKNGRLAMIAITAFAFQELVTQVGVVDETPLFFKPFGTVIKEYANSGYIQ